MSAFKWTCPYCNRPCTINNNDEALLESTAYISKEYGNFESTTQVIVCPNPECRKYSINLRIRNLNRDGSNSQRVNHIWQLVPESQAKPFPNYIPQQIIEDYSEACLIKDKSPKASATLSRRCLQGMIRDFWGVHKKNLYLEIKELEALIPNDTWEAIDAVRKIGNIGAHMEGDVNLIIDVEPEEATLLLELIESLLADWYIARHDRQQRNLKLKGIAEQKQIDQANP